MSPQTPKKPLITPEDAAATAGWSVIIVVKGVLYCIILLVAGLIMAFVPASRLIIPFLLGSSLIRKMFMWRRSFKRMDRRR